MKVIFLYCILLNPTVKRRAKEGDMPKSGAWSRGLKVGKAVVVGTEPDAPPFSAVRYVSAKLFSAPPAGRPLHRHLLPGGN